jgi:8-oxo-dGTP diphosphatase
LKKTPAKTKRKPQPQAPAEKLPYRVPRIPASAGALIFDPAGRMLILKPTYKKGWSIPGGQMEPDGETPWQACRRETLEECGLRVERGRLVCVDFLSPRRSDPGGARFIFACGTFSDAALAEIVLQAEEIGKHRLVSLPEALELLTKPISRRLAAIANAHGFPVTNPTGFLYLENGRPVTGVTFPDN